MLAGESVTLYCPGNPTFIQWLLNLDFIVQHGQLLENDNNTERFNFSCDSYSRCKLTILNAQVEDSGEYVCYDDILYIIDYYSRVTVIRKTSIIVFPHTVERR